MWRTFAKLVLPVLAIIVAVTGAQAQYRRRIEREPRQVEHPAPPVPVDKRDRVVAAPGAFAAKPYWLALAQCGGIYFKLNVLYTDVAVHARVVKPDPKSTPNTPRSSMTRSTPRPCSLTAPRGS